MGHFLERFYPYTPLWVQNVGVSLYGLCWRYERLGGPFERHVAAFRERDRWSESQMADYLRAELRRVLLHAFDQVPYYRRRWSEAGITRGDLERITPETLPSLPTTPKQHVRDDPEQFVAVDAARRHKLRRFYTSGSTGTPITSIWTTDGHRRLVAAREVRSFGWAGTSVRRPRSMIGGRRVVPHGMSRPPFYRHNWAERQTYFSAYHITPAHAADYVAGLNRYRPAVLTGYSYSHYVLARLMLEQALRLDYQPEALVLGSEKLTSEMKHVIRQAFGARAYEEYGCAENCVLATECEEGRLHASPDFGIFEIVDAAGQPVPPGVEGRVLGTRLLNEAQALIRYEIGDLATWSRAACPCGRNHLPVVEEIVGRLEDAVIGPDGREMVRFHWVYIDLPNIVEGQVVQEAVDYFRLRLVTTERFGEFEEREIRTRFAERLGNVRVEIERVPAIERTERGKFRAVVSRVPRG